MTNREKIIFDYIKKNPQVTQRELSEKLGITRSSVGVHISNLTKKGYILGRNYILCENDYLTIIGGANIDIEGKSKGAFISGDSNIGEVKKSYGGVARNIAENLAALNYNIRFMSAVGDDDDGSLLLNDLKEIGIDTSMTQVIPYFRTSTYMSILNNHGELQGAIASMEIIEELRSKHVEANIKIINNACLTIIDTNISDSLIEFIGEHVICDLFVDLVSISKAPKVKNILHKITTLKGNFDEVKALLGLSDKHSVEEAAKLLLDLGVKNIFITRGAKGIFCANKKKMAHISVPSTKVKSVTGAGDAFFAGMVKGHLEGLTIKEQSFLGATCSLLALNSRNSTPTYDDNLFNKFILEVKKCNTTKNI